MINDRLSGVSAKAAAKTSVILSFCCHLMNIVYVMDLLASKYVHFIQNTSNRSSLNPSNYRTNVLLVHIKSKQVLFSWKQCLLLSVPTANLCTAILTQAALSSGRLLTLSDLS